MSLDTDELRALLASVTDNPDVANVGPDLDLFGAGVLDSFGIIAVIGALEAELDLRVPDDDLIPNNFWNLTAIAELVDRLRTGAPT